MTIRRKPPGEKEALKDVNVLEALKHLDVFRIALLILVLSMHPAGRQLLATFGIEYPDTKRLQDASQDTALLRTEVSALKADLKELKTESFATAKSVAELKTTFSRFEVDFSRYRPQGSPQGSPQPEP